MRGRGALNASLVTGEGMVSIGLGPDTVFATYRGPLDLPTVPQTSYEVGKDPILIAGGGGDRWKTVGEGAYK